MSSIIKVDTIQTAAGGTPTAADLGLNVTGAVLQVVEATQSTTTNVDGTTSYTDSGLSGSITPSSASNKIIIITAQSGYLQRHSNDGIDAFCRLYRTTDSTELTTLYKQGRAGLGYSSQLYFPMQYSFAYIDSPNTTSEVSYKTQGKMASGYTSSSARIGFVSTGKMILMEIAG